MGDQGVPPPGVFGPGAFGPGGPPGAIGPGPQAPSFVPMPPGPVSANLYTILYLLSNTLFIDCSPSPSVRHPHGYIAGTNFLFCNIYCRS